MEESIADRVRIRMKALGMKQPTLAKRCGVEQPQLSRLLSGTVKNPTYIHELAVALQTTVSWLKTGEDEPVYGSRDKTVEKEHLTDENININYSLDALRNLYRRTSPDIQRDFRAIIKDDYVDDINPEQPKKTSLP